MPLIPKLFCSLFSFNTSKGDTSLIIYLQVRMQADVALRLLRSFEYQYDNMACSEYHQLVSVFARVEQQTRL